MDALAQARLIEPLQEIEGFGCGFERCGRTDAGVSSSAQVINLWVRSDLADPMGFGTTTTGGGEEDNDEIAFNRSSTAGESSADEQEEDTIKRTRSKGKENGNAQERKRKPGLVELPYTMILNRFLPPSIRILAWSPVTATFSSRFSCIWRHYKYFFSISPSAPFLSPRFDMGSAYKTTEEEEESEWQKNLAQVNWNGLQLDLPAMKDAATRVVGEHDYRNLCKIDPPKQLPHHMRTVTSATIDKVDGEGDDLYVLNLRGGAFLYNQVRHIVALLFLVGAKLETPDIIDRLLWTPDTPQRTEEEKERKKDWEIMETKPGYEMADDLALILWQCGYNSSEFDWRLDNSPSPRDMLPLTPDALPLSLNIDSLDSLLVDNSLAQRLQSSSLSSSTSTTDPSVRLRTPIQAISTFRRHFLEMNHLWTQQRLKSVILKHHLAALAFHTPPSPVPSSADDIAFLATPEGRTVFTPLGAGNFGRTTCYLPLLKRQRSDAPHLANQKWAAGRGRKKMESRSERAVESGKVREVNLLKKTAAREKAGMAKLTDYTKGKMMRDGNVRVEE